MRTGKLGRLGGRGGEGTRTILLLSKAYSGPYWGTLLKGSWDLVSQVISRLYLG